MLIKTQTILFIALFSLPSVYAMRVNADLFGDYVSQETEEVDQRITVGSGSRSNCKSNIEENSVSLLVPEEEVIHHTSLERPSLFLVANNLHSPETFKFTLVNPQSAKTLVEKNITVSEGIKEINLPKSTKLQLNEVYLWNIAIPCTNNTEEYREVLTAAIKRSKPSQSVKNQIYKAESNVETAAIYAKNGFWYEALEIGVKEQNRDRKDSTVNQSDYLGSLLLTPQ